MSRDKRVVELMCGIDIWSMKAMTASVYCQQVSPDVWCIVICSFASHVVPNSTSRSVSVSECFLIHKFSLSDFLKLSSSNLGLKHSHRIERSPRTWSAAQS